jgi:spore cortex formation protein SpoVR/YcgB (stage V sporulation)
MLSHYISKHGYKPPQEFIDIVMALPDKEDERDRRMYKGAVDKRKSKAHSDNIFSWIDDSCGV